ncbi:hypothetical protein RHECNPAF_890017 [Rhizobium etli CNPAF512]|nr:hypothetical protein RHECNPAF_890017 [Rhizobium etli CNPAF512]
MRLARKFALFERRHRLDRQAACGGELFDAHSNHGARAAYLRCRYHDGKSSAFAALRKWRRLIAVSLLGRSDLPAMLLLSLCLAGLARHRPGGIYPLPIAYCLLPRQSSSLP